MQDVTDKVRIGLDDSGMVPLLQCVCGCTYENWEMVLDSEPREMECCGRLLSVKVTIRVFEEVTRLPKTTSVGY